MNTTGIWYDKGPICSYNSLWNFCLGARGTGKTFCFKKWAIEKEKPTVWVRRLGEDIKDLLANDGAKFLSDMYSEGVIDVEEAESWKVRDGVLYHDGIPKIYFIPLAQSTRKKSQSYHDVDLMIYDEVFEGVGNKAYLKDEVELFLELYETVNRLRIDGRRDVRVFFLSNKTTFTNPYFVYFNIQPFEGRFKTFAKGEITVENYSNDKFKELKKASRFGSIIAESKYGKYAIDNEVWLDDNSFISEKPQNAQPILQIRYKENYVSVWTSKDGLYCMKGTIGTDMKFAPKFECRDDERALVPAKFPLKNMAQYFYAGKLKFDSNITKSIIYGLIQNGGST